MFGLRLLHLCRAVLPNADLYAVCRRSVSDADDAAPGPRDDGVRFVEATPEHHAALADLADAAGADAAVLERRFRERQHCVVAETAAGPVAFGWLCPRLALLDRGLVKADPPGIFLAERILAPGRPELEIPLQQAMLRRARDLGASRAFRIVDLAGQGSLQRATAAGWTVAGAVLLLRGWLSDQPRLTLTLGNVHPLQLLQARDDDAPPPIPTRRLVRRTLQRPLQWFRHGVFHFRLLNFATWVLSWFGESRLIFIYRRDLQNKPVQTIDARVPVTIDRAVEADADELAALEHESPERVAIYRNRLRRGDQCFVARIDGKIVASDWIRHEIGWSWTDIRVEDGDIYMTDAFTAPEWRGNQIAPAVHTRMLEYARASGYRYSFSILDATNANSWITMARSGWDLTGVVIALQTKNMAEPRFWCVSGSPHPMLIDGRKNEIDPETPLD